jgi:hypothetical protein
MRAARYNVDSVTLPALGSSKRPTWLRLVLIFVTKPTARDIVGLHCLGDLPNQRFLDGGRLKFFKLAFTFQNSSSMLSLPPSGVFSFSWLWSYAPPSRRNSFFRCVSSASSSLGASASSFEAVKDRNAVPAQHKPKSTQCDCLASWPGLPTSVHSLAMVSKAGDTVVVTRLDRLARSLLDLLNILATLNEKKVGFHSIADAWADTTTPHGRLLLGVLGSIAEFERDLIRIRTTEGRARAVANGVRLGRPPKMDLDARLEALRRIEAGEPVDEVAESYKVSPSTISRLHGAN